MIYKNSIVVAVTGGMGCGQSTVCNFLEKMGIKVINADMVAKQEVENNEEIKKELRKAFGRNIFYRNGKLNRKLLANIAFSDEAKTNRLNKIVHPQMVARILDLIEEARESGEYSIIAVDAALIYELSLEHMFDAIVVVASRMGLRIERIKQRDKLSEKEIVDRIKKQIPIEDKIKWADFVVQNNRDLKALEKQTGALYNKLKKLADAKFRSQGVA
ncbi:MAG: dephospho-CoA kinase [Calditrichia bacterium]